MALNKTEHLGLHVFPQTDEDTTLVRDVLRALAEDDNTSNMSLIDEAIYQLQTRKVTNIVWSGSQPEDQDVGDTWNEILIE